VACDNLLDDKPMRIGCLFAVTLGMMLSACGGDDTAAPPEPFELAGAWLYLGPSDVPHHLTISQTTMTYDDVEGHWSSSWTIKAYDNGSNHFQVALAAGSGTYLPVGQSMSGAYDVGGTLLTVQLAKESSSYPQLQGPGTCTGTTDGAPVPDCRLYVKMN
jgi:hypothetical protein